MIMKYWIYVILHRTKSNFAISYKVSWQRLSRIHPPQIVAEVVENGCITYSLRGVIGGPRDKFSNNPYTRELTVRGKLNTGDYYVVHLRKQDLG